MGAVFHVDTCMPVFTRVQFFQDGEGETINASTAVDGMETFMELLYQSCCDFFLLNLIEHLSAQLKKYYIIYFKRNRFLDITGISNVLCIKFKSQILTVNGNMSCYIHVTSHFKMKGSTCFESQNTYCCINISYKDLILELNVKC